LATPLHFYQIETAPKNKSTKKGDPNMPNILKLQTLSRKANLGDAENTFGSAISTICPTQAADGANGPFEME
jgi:hypothetical protein